MEGFIDLLLDGGLIADQVEPGVAVAELSCHYQIPGFVILPFYPAEVIELAVLIFRLNVIPLYPNSPF